MTYTCTKRYCYVIRPVCVCRQCWTSPISSKIRHPCWKTNPWWHCSRREFTSLFSEVVECRSFSTFRRFLLEKVRVCFGRCGDKESLDSVIRKLVVAGKELNHKDQGLHLVVRKVLGDIDQVSVALLSKSCQVSSSLTTYSCSRNATGMSKFRP